MMKALCIYINKTILVWIFFPAILISHMGFGDIYAIFARRLTSDEMQCVITSENPENVFSLDIYLHYKKNEPIKEFTMATCGCLYHQKCLKEYILNIAN
ncbi:hypothetical protein RhiirA5_38424 [Rhizophagus irregularis]|uniref:RING-type domain-containing protein n=1 Tax=Rhizophagus irregularis TaxID=588596 RepID=A0A2N0P684_9GLOM|nr:hypothetical protein RhiirA5_38424 [Rhizophagus irregularis]